MATKVTRIPEILRDDEEGILTDWLGEQAAPGLMRPGLLKEQELRATCRDFLRLLVDATSAGVIDGLAGGHWAQVKDYLTRLSQARSRQGFTPSETSMFVMSLKGPLFHRIKERIDGADELFAETLRASQLLDRLALLTAEEYQRGKEEVIRLQQTEMLELSTPVVKLWEGVLVLPLIGTLDSNRTQVVMESLLQRIVETGSQVAIIDITGVPTVDTLVAQHLMKTVEAARLMGVECMISGIRPQIAQTIVHLAIDLGKVITKATIADAFRVALEHTGASINAPLQHTNGATAAIQHERSA